MKIHNLTTEEHILDAEIDSAEFVTIGDGWRLRIKATSESGDKIVMAIDDDQLYYLISAAKSPTIDTSA